MRLLVMGCGGIGGVMTGLLGQAGHDVTAFTTNRAIAEAVRTRGLEMRVVCEIPESERFDVVLLCTQPPQVEEATRTALPFLSEGGVMVCMQNGLCEDRVAAIAGASRTIGAVVAWGAAMPEPGLYERTADGGFAIGCVPPSGIAQRVDGAVPRERLEEIARVLEVVGPVEITANLAGKRWSKLAINSAISALGTIGGDRLGALLQHRFVRRLGLEVMTECVHVARKLGVRLEKVSGTIDLDWLALTEDERTASGSPGLVAKHAMLLAVGFRYRRMRSSMLAAIERGRVPAIDFLNGEVCTRGRDLGVLTPVNDRVREWVWSIARGERKSSLETLRELTREA